jgi:hypothetical protein
MDRQAEVRRRGRLRLGVALLADHLQRTRQPQRQQLLAGIGLRREPLDGARHAQRLMRADGVVVGHPGVHRGLGLLQVSERHRIIQQLPAQALVEPLDLPVVVGDRG